MRPSGRAPPHPAVPGKESVTYADFSIQALCGKRDALAARPCASLMASGLVQAAEQLYIGQSSDAQHPYPVHTLQQSGYCKVCTCIHGCTVILALGCHWVCSSAAGLNTDV